LEQFLLDSALDESCELEETALDVSSPTTLVNSPSCRLCDEPTYDTHKYCLPCLREVGRCICSGAKCSRHSCVMLVPSVPYAPPEEYRPSRLSDLAISIRENGWISGFTGSVFSSNHIVITQILGLSSAVVNQLPGLIRVWKSTNDLRIVGMAAVLSPFLSPERFSQVLDTLDRLPTIQYGAFGFGFVRSNGQLHIRLGPLTMPIQGNPLTLAASLSGSLRKLQTMLPAQFDAQKNLLNRLADEQLRSSSVLSSFGQEMQMLSSQSEAQHQALTQLSDATTSTYRSLSHGLSTGIGSLADKIENAGSSQATASQRLSAALDSQGTNVMKALDFISSFQRSNNISHAQMSTLLDRYTSQDRFSSQLDGYASNKANGLLAAVRALLRLN